MKTIHLLTTFEDSEENELIGKEAKLLGYKFKSIDLNDFIIEMDKNGPKLNKFKEIDNSIVIVRGVLNSIRPLSVLLQEFRKRGVKVFDNSLMTHQYSIDKVTDLLKISLMNIPIPRTFYSRNFDDYESFAVKLKFPVIVKLTRSGKGDNVYKVDKMKELSTLISKLNKKREAKDFIIQEFIPYRYDLRCLVMGRNVMTMRRVPAKGEFRANFSLGGGVELYDLSREGKELALRALSAVNITVGGVDILISDEGMHILEVNHVAGFVGMQKATGMNIAKIYLEHAIEEAK